MTQTARTVRCPTCGKEVEWQPQSRFRPFCSERCKQIDLGAWASEAYRVPTAPPDAELPDTPHPDEMPSRRG